MNKNGAFFVKIVEVGRVELPSMQANQAPLQVY